MNANQRRHATFGRGPDSPSASLAEQVLAHAQAGREIVQDFVPLAESLEWELGQQYLRDRGNKAFLADASPVPYVVNNDGTLSRNAAVVFFASVQEAENKGDLDPDIYALELGIGVGLFASRPANRIPARRQCTAGSARVRRRLSARPTRRGGSTWSDRRASGAVLGGAAQFRY
jgi:hypothetical protein